jgi:pimeloyl-ACP methyl ester carboxylesterase
VKGFSAERSVVLAHRPDNQYWCGPKAHGIDAHPAALELLQPFAGALDPRRPVIRFDMPGIGGSPAPVIPYHLATLPSLLAGHLELAADSERLAPPWRHFLPRGAEDDPDR